MNNVVNRAPDVGAKKNQFLSKAVPRGTRTIWRYLGALFLLFTFAIGQMWGEVVGKNTSTTGTIIYSNINSTGSGVNLTAGTEENGFNAISGASFKSGPGVISVAENGYFALCVDDITEGTVYHTMTVTSNVPDWTSTSGGSNGRYAQLYIGDTGAKKYLYTKYSTNTTVEEATGLTKEGSNVRGIYSFSFTSSDLTTIGTKKYLKFKALGGEYKPAGFKIVASTTPAVDTQAPTLSSSLPANNANDIAVSGDIALTFSENVTINDASKFTLSGGAGSLTTADFSASGAVVTLPYANLANSTEYTLSIAADAVKDGSNNKNTASYSVKFMTVAASSGGGEDPEPTCPTEGQLYSAVTTATGNISIATTTGLELNTSTHKTTVSGGKMYVVSGQSSNKNLITNGAFCQTNDNTFFKIELDCALAAGDVISISVGKDGSNTRGVWVSTATSKPSSAPACALTAKSSTLTPKTYTVTSTDEYVGKNVFYIYRATGNSTYFNNVVITRPYSVSYAELKEVAHTMPTKAVEFTLQELTHASFTHLGWTADKLVKVGGADKAAGTTLGKTDVVTLTDNTTFTATWEAKVTKYTVTYYDGEAIEANKLGSELINEGSNPTGAGLAPKKQGYTFGGWSLTNGGDAIASYASVTVDENKNLFAVWTPVVCPTKGTVFSFVMNNDAKPGSEVKAPVKDTLIVNKYLTISGSGDVVIGNTTNNNNQYASVRTEPDIKLSGTTAYVRLALDCQLAEGDVITIAKNGTQIIISDEIGSSGPTGNKYTTANNSENTIVVGANETTAEWVGSRDLYFWYKGGGVNITAISVSRPYTVSFNMNGKSATAIADQKIVSGGKVTKPTDPVVTGQAFGGWYQNSTCTGDAWDFTNDVVNDDVELFAKWTALPSMTLVAGTGATGDPIVSYPTVGNPVAVPACPAAFEKTGYIFAGWTYSPSVTVEAGQFTMPNEDLTLTAQWDEANKVAKIGDVKYETLEDALLHAADGTIELLQDIDVTAQVEIAASVTAVIDLAGYKIEYTGTDVLPSGVILVHNGASLTINDSSDPDAGSIVSGDKAYAAVALTKLGDDASTPATLVVNGGALTGYYYGITGNGSRNNTVITINGGTITGTVGIAIYHPQVGTLTVNNGSLTGEDAAIEMRAGTLVINDGTFTATATEFSCNPNGSGSTTSGAAIAIAQHTTKKEISVTINGGTFNGVKALNESNPQVNDPAPQVTMAITNGTFNGAVSTVDVNNFVSGGSFSEPVAEANCATDYYPATKPNGKYGVTEAAVSVDFAEEAAKTEGQKAWATFLADNHYDYNLGSGGEISWDKANTYDTGLKLKKSTANALYFTTEPDKVITLTVGNIAGMTIQINGGEAQPIASGTDATNLGVSTYYSANAQTVVLKETSGSSGYNMLKSIVIRDPYQVTLDATTNGGEAVAPMYGKLSVTLPSATKGTDHFIGWYDRATEEGRVLVGLAGAEYTPTANITLYAHFAPQSNDATLASWEIDGVDTPVPTEPGNLIHRINVPYGTAVSALPKITAAVAHDATYAQSVDIYPAAGPEWQAGVDGGCYVQQVIVTAEDGTKGYYHVRTKILPKDMMMMIKATHDGTTTGATIEGYFGGEKDKVTYNDGKLGEANRYFGIKLAEEAGTFKAGDVLKIYATNPSAAVRIYSDKGTTRINPTDGTFDSEKMFTYTLTEDEEWIYLYRRYKETETDMNPTLGYMAVYRPYPNPLVGTITFNGAAGTVDNDLKTITVEVPATTNLATMPVVASFLSNDPSQTNGAVTGSWAEGDNEYIVTDKDNDQTVYTVTITKAVPSNDATLSALSYGGTAIALADGVYEYDVELPYGTSAVPALAATAHHAGATIESIDDATAFVDRKATSTVTVKAEDDATVQVYTVSFTVSRFESKVLWDGSTMDELSDISALSIETADISVDSKNASFEGKNYTKALSFGGNTKNTRYFGIVVPEGKVAKVSIVYRSRGTSARSIIIGTAIESAIDESAIVYATKENDTELLYKLTADIFAAGTIYINTTNGFQVFEIDVQLADGYARSAMLGAGVYGTVCVPNNVAIEDIQGVTVYELMGREPQYGKLAFDEIISGELEAGVPYVFQAHGNHMALLYGTTSVAEPVDKHNGMYGTFEQIVLTDLTDVYYFAQKALWSCDGAIDLTVGANRAYVKLGEIDYLTDPNPAPGRRRVTMAVNGEKVTTDIENFNASEKPVKLLINGQLFIIRGEKMFNANGQLVK